MRLSTKLFLAFFILVVVVGVTGGSGLFFARRIQVLSDMATPLVKTSSELVNTIQSATISFLELPNLKDEQQIQAQANTLDELDGEFQEKLGTLSEIIAATNIQLDIQTIAQMQQEFFKQAREGVVAYQEMLILQKEAVIKQKLEDLQNQRQELDMVLRDFANRNEAAVNRKEDESRTLGQSEMATVEDMVNIVVELFNHDYPLVQGAFILQRYLIQLQDISRSYLAEQDENKLPAIEEKFGSIIKLANSRLKRLKSRAKTEENKQDVQKLVEGLAKLQDIGLSENGLFIVYREDLKVRSNVERLQKRLTSATHDSKLMCNGILEAVSTFSEQARMTAKNEVRKAQRNIGAIIIFGIIIGLLSAWLTTRAITRPVTKIVKIATDIANGDLGKEIDIRRSDEIGRLADAFCHMQDRINDVLQEMNDLIQAIQDGKLDSRGNTAAFAGGWQDFVVGVNNVVDAFVAPINVTAEYLDRLSKGDIPDKITEEYKGDFNEIKQNVNTLIGAMNETTRIAEEIANGNLQVDVRERSAQDRLMKALNMMIHRLNEILQEMKTLVQNVQDGNLTTRGNARLFEGGWRDLVAGVNSLIDAFVKPITTAANYIDRIAKGDIPETLREAYQGDFNEIQQNLNKLIEAMQEITWLAEAMAEGDFSIEVTERSDQDTLMHALNTMCSKLKEVVLHVKTVASMVAVGSGEIQQTSEHMSQGATQQAAATEEASSSMEQMAANIRQNADNAQQTEHIALQSTQYAEESGNVVAEAVMAMQQIARKITIIQEIAEQTRMLSLNATIEAARAQNHGRAFSVVASEVRKLSDITKTAAEEINELASSSLDISEKAGEMLKTLVPNIQKTAELVQEISAASGEQRIGAEQVNKAIQQLDQITQQNAITAEQMSSTAEEFARQASQLQQMIAFFRVTESPKELQEGETRKTIVADNSSTAGVSPPVMSRQDQSENGTSGLTEDARPDEHIFDIEQDDQDDEFERY
jgi:methyl-accepting chemotaxis protein